MIPDAYTETHQIGGVDVLIRPFTRHDRRAIGEYLNSIPETLAHRAERQLVLSRVVDCDGDVEDLDYERLWTLAMGVNNTLREIDDETNLARGVYLQARFPWMQRNSCETCKAWMWMPLTGETVRRDGAAVRRTGKPLCETPARDFRHSDTACPRGHWSKPNQLSEKNQAAYRHFKACEATGTFPDDPIVRRNAGIIRNAHRFADKDSSVDGRAGGGSGAARQLRHPARPQRRTAGSA